MFGHEHFLEPFRLQLSVVAPGTLETARQVAAQVGSTGINYEQRDLNVLTLPENTYDAAWFWLSLHHVQNLEYVLKQVQQSLKPDGFLILSEYIGANRFDFSPHQKAILKASYSLIPHCFRRFLGKGGPEFLENVGIPILKLCEGLTHLKSLGLLKLWQP